MAEKLATLSFSDGSPSVDFPVLGGTIGPEVIDVRSLYGKTGKFTYDPGFMATAWAPDETVEAMEVPGDRFCVGVQWHPEMGRDQALFSALVAAAARWSRKAR